MEGGRGSLKSKKDGGLGDQEENRSNGWSGLTGLEVRAKLFSVQLLARAKHPPQAQMLAHQPPQPSPASHLSLAVSFPGWPAGVENQPLMGLWGLEEGSVGVVDRMKAPGAAACTD
ncbi:unnamed protein product [Pleuronectes platessa]|uniref:Uncharacterized protein n=1 Tax=Pleuronectes platessa TaxID=8262 RepID=A0A9N7VLY9_PLEPL|nr:unnamed protein product [Pleuronectes platessa]